ncbi:MAG: hypothetical protein R3C68_03195 [Myxococcota bacterium]
MSPEKQRRITFSLTPRCGYRFLLQCQNESSPARRGGSAGSHRWLLKDGTLPPLAATDHAPHSSIEKDVAFAEAANGNIGLQTALPLSLELWRKEGMTALDVIARLTSGPAGGLGP